MIRFCDKDVFCIGYDMLDRATLLSYFLGGNRRALVCVMDDAGKYLGMITYASLLNCDNVFYAIQYDSVVMDENIWKCGRAFFKDKESLNICNGDISYLPVLDKEKNLLYFAYQDDEANREIRMLWELLEGSREDKNYLNFSDLFPEYECVTVQGCNELAWYFVQYLISIGIPVNVEGEIWQQLGEWKWHESVDYKNLRIYAEGTWPKEENMLKYILRSVSVEFECIDRIYEENIKTGLIKDAEGDYRKLLERLKPEEVVILGTDANAQDAYDLLYGCGIDIYGFCSTDAKEQRYRLLGKPVIGMHQAVSVLKHPVFIECSAKHSAWGGVADIDRLAYIGYRRNDQIFFLRDYREIHSNQLQNVLRFKKLVLAGNHLLCQRLSQFLKEYEVGKNIRYIGGIDECTVIIQDDEICLVAEPVYYFWEKVNFSNKREERIRKFAKRTNMVCYTEYFSSDVPYLEMKLDLSRHLCSNLRPKGVLLGAIHAFCGNYLMQDILDGHPDILRMEHGFLNNNLYFICLMLAEMKSSDILAEFWKLYNCEVRNNNIQFPEFDKPDIFSRKMKEMLAESECFTSQELFVMFHIAYAAMHSTEKTSMKEVIIYFEPHFVDRNICRRYSVWLNEGNIHGVIISIARNACIRAGSVLKGFITKKVAGWTCIWNSVDLEKDEIECSCWETVNVRFEDIKCSPQETLKVICEKVGLRWSDILLNPRKVHRPGYASGFDLKPVYNDYEEYFSSYDRARISMINYFWQKKYGYSCISCIDFSKKELQEMLLKKYRFEELYNFSNEEVKILCRLHIKKRSLASLLEIRRVGITGID